jgi:hypothetical protein
MTKKTELPFLHWLVIGDWSDDGHSDKQFIAFRCTHDEKAVQKAYLAACKKGNVALHEDHKSGAEHVIACDYEDSKLRPDARKALKDLGVDLSLLGGNPDDADDAGTYLGPQDIVVLFAEMVKTQIDGFNYKLPENTRLPTLNGFWKKDFNLQFGYGVTGRG